AVELVALADRVRQRSDPEQVAQREAADGHDQIRIEQPELRCAPRRAQLTLLGGRRAVAASGRSTTRVAACDGGAVEGLVERGLVELQPASQGHACPASPGAAFHALDHTRCLSQQIRPLPGVTLDDGPGLDRVAGLEAEPAPAVLALKRPDRATS